MWKCLPMAKIIQLLKEQLGLEAYYLTLNRVWMCVHASVKECASCCVAVIQSFIVLEHLLNVSILAMQ